MADRLAGAGKMFALLLLSKLFACLLVHGLHHKHILQLKFGQFEHLAGHLAGACEQFCQ